MGEQIVEEFEVIDAEVGEGVVVDADAAAEPAEGIVLDAEGVDGAGGSDPFEGGVEPQGGGQPGIEGGATGPAFAGADEVGQGREASPRQKSRTTRA